MRAIVNEKGVSFINITYPKDKNFEDMSRSDSIFIISSSLLVFLFMQKNKRVILELLI